MMQGRPIEDPQGTGRVPDGWGLVQLARLARDVERRAHEVAFRLRGFDPEDLEVMDRAKLDAGVLADVLDRVCALSDAAEQAGIVGGSFVPPGGTLRFSRGEIAAGAAEALATGIGDPALVLLAARVLSIEHGWRALAAALVSADTYRSWGPLAVGELVGAFIGARPELVRRALAAARVAQAREFEGLTFPEAERLALALEEHAPPRDPRVVWAVDHPVRATIVLMLREHETTTAGDVARELHMPTARVSYHFRRLTELGLLEVKEIAPRRGAVKHVYRFADGAASDELIEHARRRLEGGSARSCRPRHGRRSGT